MMKPRALFPRIGLAAVLFFAVSTVFGAKDTAYYREAIGKSRYELKTALHSIIKTHTEISYNGLWNAYKKTDVRENGKVWDMYSDCEFTFGSNQCGTYQNECDCYNREHSFPKSWFKEGKPMYSDLFHLYPTDGKVNGMRGNNPFGEVKNPSYTSNNGSKLGQYITTGFSGTVFEPIDEYKGDFARSYFYMATCYEDVIASWSACPICSGDNKASFKQWTIDLLLKWHRQDPVSEKEIKRNDAVYAQQHNRNPFIDFPELVEKIWGIDETPFGSNNPSVGPDPIVPGPDDIAYEIRYEYRDAQGGFVRGSEHTLAFTIPTAKRQAKEGEETVLMDENFPSVNDQENGVSATVSNTGSKYVASFDNIFTYGVSGVRLGTSKKGGSIVFKEFNVNGDFTVNINGKGWNDNEKNFALKCEGCVQDSQALSFIKSKKDLSALDQYETLAPVTLSANGKVILTVSASKGSRVILDRVKVVSGNDGGIPDDPDPDDPDPDDPDPDPDDPDLTDDFKIKVLYPAAGDVVRQDSVKARVAVVDKDNKEIKNYTLKGVALPDTGNYTFVARFWKKNTKLDEQRVVFVYKNNSIPTDNEDVAAVAYRIYPNPTSGMLTLDVEENNYHVRVFTVAGVEVMNLKALNSKTQINLEGMAQGVYVVEIATVNGTSRAKVVLR